MAHFAELWAVIQAFATTRPGVFAAIVVAVMIGEGLVIALTLEGVFRLIFGSRRNSRPK